jgi:hypothetical protein
VVFSTVHAFEYTAVVASPGFIGGPTYKGHVNTWTSNEVLGNEATLADVQKVQADAAEYERLENKDCINAYKKALLTDRSDLVLVTMYHNASDDQSNVFIVYRDGDFYVDFEGTAAWIEDTHNEAQVEVFLNTGVYQTDPSDWILDRWRIDHCSVAQNGRCAR